MSEDKKEEQVINKNKLSIKKPIIWFVVGIILIVFVFIIFENLKYQSTDDAYVDTITVNVAPRVAGEIMQVYVTDNQRVKKGDLVAVIDPSDYRAKFEQAEALYQRELLSQTNAKANLIATNSELELAKVDMERYERLYNAGAVSKQTLDRAKIKYDGLVAHQVSANENVLSYGVKDRKVADANLKVLKAQRDAADLSLSYTKIFAPQDGTVSSRRVEKGLMVSAGSPLFTLVPDKIWIVANFKETQIAGMKNGMPVEIKVDAYPKHKFKGKIDSIQNSSGAKSSLFPPENAVGSFVKIVQRVPVKIVFDEKIDTAKYTIVPGMSVVPKVKVK